MKERIVYFDVLKCILMFLIYSAHCGDALGRGYFFAFYSVPTFFFVSGCCESFHKDESLLVDIFRKIKTILLPWWFLSVLNCCFVSFEVGSLEALKSNLLITIKGDIRNTALSPGLWFLTCLFVVSSMFIVIKRLHNNLLIFGAAYIIYFISQFCMSVPPTNSPSMPFNIDSAMSYLIYYTLGYLLFSPLKNMYENTENKKYLRVAKYFIGISSFIYIFFIWFGKDIFWRLYNIKYYKFFGDIISNIVVIIGILTIAFMLKFVNLFSKWGKETLFFCGTELITKNVFNSILGLFSLKIDFYRPLAVYIYAMLTMTFAYYIIIPITKRIYFSLINRN